MPEADFPEQPTDRIPDLKNIRDAVRLLEPVSRQNVALAALDPVLVPVLRRSAPTDERNALSSQLRGLADSHLDLLRDPMGRITQEFRILSALHRLAGRGAVLDPPTLAAELRTDNDSRLRPRMYRGHVLRQRGGVMPSGSVLDLLRAHAQVVAARALLDRGVSLSPRGVDQLVEGLGREPVNFRGAMRAAETALSDDNARRFLGAARRDRRIAVGVVAGEGAATAGGLALSGWFFAVLPPGKALMASLAALLPGGATFVKERVRPTRVNRRMDAVNQAKVKAERADAEADRAWKEFVRQPNQTGPATRRR